MRKTLSTIGWLMLLPKVLWIAWCSYPMTNTWIEQNRSKSIIAKGRPSFHILSKYVTCKDSDSSCEPKQLSKVKWGNEAELVWKTHIWETFLRIGESRALFHNVIWRFTDGWVYWSFPIYSSDFNYPEILRSGFSNQQHDGLESTPSFSTQDDVRAYCNSCHTWINSLSDDEIVYKLSKFVNEAALDAFNDYATWAKKCADEYKKKELDSETKVQRASDRCKFIETWKNWFVLKSIFTPIRWSNY